MRQTATLFIALVFLLSFVCVLQAEDAVVVSFTKGKLVMKIGNKTETIPIKGVKVTDSGGTEIKAATLPKTLKKDVKVALVREGGRIVMVVVK